jgi:ribosomal-protein-alanine N-acetyltransferase
MEDNETAHVMSIAVDKENRRIGIGKRLLGTMLRAYANTGVTRILLEVRESNLDAQKFYSALGFKRLGRLNSYYVDGEHALTYEIKDADLIAWVQNFNSTFST